jgi:hypothetical protein
LEALRIQRQAEVIEATGWTLKEFDAADRRRVTEILEYRGIKSAVQAEKQEWDARSHR